MAYSYLGVVALSSLACEAGDIGNDLCIYDHLFNQHTYIQLPARALAVFGGQNLFIAKKRCMVINELWVLLPCKLHAVEMVYFDITS